MKPNKPHTEGFKVPQHYFEEFDDRLYDQIDLPVLSGEAGFEVPENYFVAVERDILKALPSTENRIEKRVISLYARWTLAACAAAAVLLFVVIPSVMENSIDIERLSPIAIEGYIEDNQIEYDTYDLTPFLSESALSENIIDDELFSDANLADYLLEHIDETTLINE
ncbi:MAG: hypothetical protein CMC08_02365 [Flavobacteriaceae bacterium]|nr:hypothetical protein [Flavobacteriaceae bacterium]